MVPAGGEGVAVDLQVAGGDLLGSGPVPAFLGEGQQPRQNAQKQQVGGAGMSADWLHLQRWHRNHQPGAVPQRRNGPFRVVALAWEHW